VTITLFIFYQ